MPLVESELCVLFWFRYLPTEFRDTELGKCIHVYTNCPNFWALWRLLFCRAV